MSATQTSMAALKTAAPPVKAGDDATELGFFSGPAFALTYRVAAVFAGSTLVPKHYQGNPGNAMIALNMAQRLGADPLMVMQNLYVVHGTPAWSAQFLIATFNKCGRFSALRYEFQGKEGEDGWGCRAVAVELATGEKLTGPLVTIGLAKKEGWFGKAGSKWQTMPEQMLRYRAAAWFVRAYAPEIAMGLHTSDEMLDAKVNELGQFEVTGAATISTAEIKESSKPSDDGTGEGPSPFDGAPPPLCRETRDLIENEIFRLGGLAGYLPENLAARYETRDVSKLSEPQGKDALAELKKMSAMKDKK